ncbi:uncharacterized protein LOC133849137 [Drosophila sulfurigaster albostrigata]|uniref:uncharacterized protein LOC133849137 n=1 Tax=Drosophila sulfurigaster albostrigata TaxID=89887 RepID=UPI002D21C57D|nr:uncharacterized protein LOC133849137 [Drosophila sulfurigaster albostrigata]
MISALPKSCLLALLATLVCVALSVSQVAAVPVTMAPPHNERLMKLCSDNLNEAIQLICNGRTLSLAQLYPNSFGPSRAKRFSSGQFLHNPRQEGSVHMCCIHRCTKEDLNQFCAPD